MNELKKALALLCALLFIASSVTALLSYNIEQRAFSADIYKQVLKEQGLYEQAPALLTSILSNLNGMPELLSFIGIDKLETLISSLLPPDQMEALTNSILDSTFAYLNNESDTISVSLLSLKQGLLDMGGAQVFDRALNALPACTIEQLFQMGANMLLGNENAILCNPPQELVTLVTPLIEAQFQTVIGGIPNEILLVDVANPRMLAFKARVDSLRKVMKISLWLPLIFLFGMTLFAVRNLNNWLKWWGFSLIVTGLTSVVTALMGAPLLAGLMKLFILKGNEGMPPLLSNLIENITRATAHHILQPMTTQGLIVTVAGLLLVGANFLIGKYNTANR